jgi:hypothetical protein
VQAVSFSRQGLDRGCIDKRLLSSSTPWKPTEPTTRLAFQPMSKTHPPPQKA